MTVGNRKERFEDALRRAAKHAMRNGKSATLVFKGQKHQITLDDASRILSREKTEQYLAGLKRKRERLGARILNFDAWAGELKRDLEHGLQNLDVKIASEEDFFATIHGKS